MCPLCKIFKMEWQIYLIIIKVLIENNFYYKTENTQQNYTVQHKMCMEQLEFMLPNKHFPFLTESSEAFRTLLLSIFDISISKVLFLYSSFLLSCLLRKQGSLSFPKLIPPDLSLCLSLHLLQKLAPLINPPSSCLKIQSLQPHSYLCEHSGVYGIHAWMQNNANE